MTCRAWSGSLDESDQGNRARADLDKRDGGPSRERPGFRRASLVAGRTPERLARAGANTKLVDRGADGWARAIEDGWVGVITNEEKWWAQ